MTDTHTVVASLNLSGEDVLVGVYSHATGESVYFKTRENVEPVYINSTETWLLIAALQAAQERIERQEA